MKSDNHTESYRVEEPPLWERSSKTIDKQTRSSRKKSSQVESSLHEMINPREEKREKSRAEQIRSLREMD